MKSLQLVIASLLLFNSNLFSAELSLLGKRTSLNKEEPIPKKSKSIHKHAVENLENIARENIPFEGELKDYLTQKNGIADEKDNTLLHYAVLYHNEPLLLELLKNEYIDINSFNTQGESPLALAVFVNNQQAVEALLQYNPEFLCAFNALKTAYIIGNAFVIKMLEDFLNAHPYPITCTTISDHQIGKIKTIHFERLEAFKLFKQSQDLKQIILNTPEFLQKLQIEGRGNILNPDWRSLRKLLPNFVATMEDIISQPENLCWFISIFSKEIQEEYFYIFIELFFGEDVADWAFDAIGDKDLSPVQNVTLFVHNQNRGIDEDDAVTDEFLPYLEKIPQMSARIIINAFKYKRLKTLKKVLDNTPSYFTNIEKIKEADLFHHAVFAATKYKKHDFLTIFMKNNSYNINRKFCNENTETMLESLLYREVNIDIFKLVLSYKPNINYKDNTTNSYLMNLVYYPEKMPYIQEILQFNPDLSLRNEIRRTALEIAIEQNNLAATSLILEKIINDRNSYFYNHIESYTSKIKTAFFDKKHADHAPTVIKLQDQLKNISSMVSSTHSKKWQKVWH